MPVHYREDKYLDKIIKEKFSTALMNNSKWVKLITTLISNTSHIKECRVKPIWDDQEPTRKLLIDKNLQFGIDYYNSAMEAMISGNPTGWYAYKEIEWLDFPRVVNPNNQQYKTEEQNLELIKTIVDKLGEFYSELSESNLRLYAYLRNKIF